MFSGASSVGLCDETINNIVDILKPYLRDQSGLPPDADAKVEYLVSQLYGLSKDDYEHIFNALEDVEELVPVKCLKSITIEDVFSRGY